MSILSFLQDILADQNAVSLPDHDISVLTVSPTSTAWEHTYACTECLSPVGHSEFMTQICLSCGSAMRCLPHSAATRKITIGGEWVQTIRVHNVEHAKRDGKWAPIRSSGAPS